MTAKKASMAAALCAAAALLGGCTLMEESVWEPQEADAISIESDGSVTEIVQETLDESYYDASELQSLITASVQEYNQENGADAVQVSGFETEGQEVTLTLKFATAEDYAQFNNVDFYYGTMINAQIEGYLFDTSFQKVSGGVAMSGEVDGSEVIKSMAAQVLVVQAPLEVHIDGELLYTSTNAEVLSSDTVNAHGRTEETESLVLPSDAVYEGEKTTVEEQKKANRVYIIFDTE